MQMPNLYTHLDPGHLSQFADRTLIGTDETVTKTVTEKLKRKRKRGRVEKWRGNNRR